MPSSTGTPTSHPRYTFRHPGRLVNKHFGQCIHLLSSLTEKHLFRVTGCYTLIYWVFPVVHILSLHDLLLFFWQLYSIKSSTSSSSPGSRDTFSCALWRGNWLKLSSTSSCRFLCHCLVCVMKEANMVPSWYAVLAPGERNHFIIFCRKIRKEISTKRLPVYSSRAKNIYDSLITVRKMVCEMFYLHFSSIPLQNYWRALSPFVQMRKMKFREISKARQYHKNIMTKFSSSLRSYKLHLSELWVKKKCCQDERKHAESSRPIKLMKSFSFLPIGVLNFKTY